MKTFIGNGKGTTKSAIEEAIRGLHAPSVILFMAPFTALEETAKILAEKFPQAQSIGTIGTKIANGNVGEDNIVVLGFFDDIVASCGVIEHLSTYPVMAIAEFEKNLNQIVPGKEDSVCIEFCTGDEEKLVTTLQTCLGKKKVSLAGGSVFGIPEGKNGIVAYNGVVYEEACVYALIKNLTGKIKVFKENIYRKKENAISHYATKVDISSRTLIELDGKPAAAVYSQELGIPKEKIVDNVFTNPMGRAVGDQVFISSMKEMSKSGDIVNYKCINKNDCIYFLELGDYKAIEEETRQLMKSQTDKISLVISVDCVYRYLLYTNEGYFQTYAKDMATLGNHVGVIGGGEQFNNQHVNQTMVCAVFE